MSDEPGGLIANLQRWQAQARVGDAIERELAGSASVKLLMASLPQMADAAMRELCDASPADTKAIAKVQARLMALGEIPRILDEAVAKGKAAALALDREVAADDQPDR